MELILHMAQRVAWEQGRSTGSYRVESLESEGFMHCSTFSQIVATANRINHGRRDIVLLYIDPARVQAEIKYEGRPGGERYPHIYGPLNLDAVVQERDFLPTPDGTFSQPPLFG